MSVVAAVLVAAAVLAAGVGRHGSGLPGRHGLSCRRASPRCSASAMPSPRSLPTVLVGGPRLRPRRRRRAVLVVVVAALAVGRGRRSPCVRSADAVRAQIGPTRCRLAPAALVVIADRGLRGSAIPVDAACTAAGATGRTGSSWPTSATSPPPRCSGASCTRPRSRKLVGNAFTGELSFVFAAHPLAGDGRGALALGRRDTRPGLWALGWELGLRRTAPLLPLLGIAGAQPAARDLAERRHHRQADVLPGRGHGPDGGRDRRRHALPAMRGRGRPAAPGGGRDRAGSRAR